MGLLALANAQMIQTSFGSLGSGNIALQAQQYASAKADIIKATAYDDLESQSKKIIQNSNDFWDAVELSPEESYSDEIKQRTATVNIYRGSEPEPRYSLKVLRLSREVKASGVPIGTVIIWPANFSKDFCRQRDGSACIAVYDANLGFAGNKLLVYFALCDFCFIPIAA